MSASRTYRHCFESWILYGTLENPVTDSAGADYPESCHLRYRSARSCCISSLLPTMMS